MTFLTQSLPAQDHLPEHRYSAIFTFARFGSPHFFVLLGLTLVQQSLVGGTVYSLAAVVKNVAGGQNPWPMLILTACLFLLPHLPAYFIQPTQARWQVAIMVGQVQRYSRRFARQPLDYANGPVRDRALAAAASEAYVVAQSTVTIVEGFLSSFFNALFTIVPILIFVDAKYFLAYAMTAVISLVTFRILHRDIRVCSRAAQEARVALDRGIRSSWTRLTIGSQRQRQAAAQRMNAALNDAERRFCARERRIAAGTSLVGALALALILTITFRLFSTHAGDIAFLSVLIASFPRHIQIISQIIGVAQLCFSAPRLLEEIRNIDLDDLPSQTEKNVSRRISADRITINHVPLAGDLETIDATRFAHGRHLIEGPNGCGKSTLLALLAARAGKKPYVFIPAAPAALAEPDATGSTGEIMLRLINEMLDDDTVDLIFLDEWDANLDANARRTIEHALDRLAERVTVIEVRHPR
ncbi:ABC transporter ATP-binding protein/permease [Martelella sp. HB161492]|uniref:ABC transporter ATP-binding protein/permease n=1 Tax=Martelella sp. HB161492 TaxID=2720726 RepID=UPI001590963B|nr:ABC transporter ATP-binding protein/permease [Martelella sp. HB161492]